MYKSNAKALLASASGAGSPGAVSWAAGGVEGVGVTGSVGFSVGFTGSEGVVGDSLLAGLLDSHAIAASRIVDKRAVLNIIVIEFSKLISAGSPRRSCWC